MPSSTYDDWSLGEIIDRMIRLRLKERLTIDEKTEYANLVSRLDTLPLQESMPEV